MSSRDRRPAADRRRRLPVVTVRAPEAAAAPARRERLVEVANQRASGLLSESTDRVLVVYEEKAASLYYEREEQAPRATKVS